MKYKVFGINKNCEEFSKAFATMEQAENYKMIAEARGCFSVHISEGTWTIAGKWIDPSKFTDDMEVDKKTAQEYIELDFGNVVSNDENGRAVSMEGMAGGTYTAWIEDEEYGVGPAGFFDDFNEAWKWLSEKAA